MKLEYPCIKKALLFNTEGDKIRCLTCEHRCILKKGQTGKCKTRQNLDGIMYTLIYGDISSISLNPIEKKPFFHFYPNSRALTIGSYSCNFDCPWCQNYEISKRQPIIESCNYISPEKIVKIAINRNAHGISYSFNEPTLLLEHSLETFRAAKKNNLYTNYVTNGYMTLNALKLLIESGLDAMNIDIKGNVQTVKKYCGADVDKVFRNAKYAVEKEIHVEITTLVITEVNDDDHTLRKIASRILRDLGEKTPWHVTRYFPQYKFNNPPTPIKTLEKARKIGFEEGLLYVYIGNVLGHSGENTYCPNCGKLLIERNIFDVTKNNLTKNNTCPNCGFKIQLIN
ncbi:MAG: AmmeMemoRadiSam system radical SAM enzyme [Candidatus Helarchaeota archaeon]